jgi:uncharacterized membrane protein
MYTKITVLKKEESMPETITEKGNYTTHKTDLREVIQDRESISSSRSKSCLPNIVGGGLLTWFGLTRPSVGRLVLAGVGTGLLYHGLQALRTSSTSGLGRRKIKPSRAVKIENSIIIHRRHEELFRFWRQLDNLPRFMDDIERIEILSPTRSRWIMAVPAMENVPGPSRVEWEAEIINEKEHEGIGWRTMDHSDVDHAGSVQFKPLDDGNATEVRVTLQYSPVGGLIGAGVLKMLGEDPQRKIQQNLRKFKDLMEAGHAG